MKNLTDAQKCTTEVRTQKDGTRWLRIQVPFGGARFSKVIREIADAHGVARVGNCRVLSKSGQKVWKTYGPTTWVSYSSGYAPGYNTVGYFLPVAA